MQKQKILIILPWLPFPLKTGGHQAIFNGIDVIKDIYNIYITFETVSDDNYSEAEQHFRDIMPTINICPLLHPVSEPIPIPKIAFRNRVKNKIKSLLHIKDKKNAPTHTIHFTNNQETTIANTWKYMFLPPSKEWTEHIHNLCKKYHFDIIQVEMPRMLSNIFILPKDAIKIFIHHELGFVRRELEFNNGINSPFAESCKDFADQNEIRQLNMYDAVITLSDIDSNKLKEKGVYKPIYTSFATINTNEDKYYRHNTTPQKRLTFIGSGSHEPNIYGLTWFLDKCWPILKEIDSEYTLDVIGRWSEKQIQSYVDTYKDINFLGFVEILSDVIHGSIMIVPITVGSGIRMKILEAAYNRVAFVSTDIGAEGLPLRNGTECFIANEPEKFVNSILKLQDPILYNQMAKNAKDVIEKHYSIKTLKENRLSIYRNLNKL